MTTTKTEKTTNQNLPLRTRLLSKGFIDVTGLREYLLGFIPTREVGASILAMDIKSYAVLGMPPGSRWLGYEGPGPKVEDLYLVIVDENGRVLLSKRNINGSGRIIAPQDLDIRLLEFADRTYDDSFIKTVVRPHRLRPCDIFARFAEPIPGLDQ